MSILPIYLCLFLTTSGAQESPGLTLLLKDRPQLLDIVQTGDPVWTWLNSRFASTNGLPALWSPDEPTGPAHYLSFHTYDATGRAVIRARHRGNDGKPLAAEQLLSVIVFELINATHRDAFFKLRASAIAGTLSKQEFIEQMARVEFDSKMQIKQFTVDVWIPYAVSKHLPFQNDYWSKGVPEDFDQWLYDCRLMRDGYPDDIYGPFYDKLSRAEKTK